MENNEVRNNATNEEIFESIKKYENVLLNNPITPVALAAVMSRIYVLKNLLYKNNKDNNKEVIINEAVEFVRFQEDLLFCGLSNALFGRTIRHIYQDYVKLSSLDDNNLLYNQCQKTLKKVRNAVIYSAHRVIGIDKYRISIKDIKNKKDLAVSYNKEN